MDPFIIREPRAGRDIQQRNMLAFTPGTRKQFNMVPETMYFGGYGAEFPNQHVAGRAPNPQLNSPYQQYPDVAPNHPNNHPPESQMASGIDPRYLAIYSDSNAAYVAGQRQQLEIEHRANSSFPQHNPPINHQFMTDYRDNNNNFTDRHIGDMFSPQHMPMPMASPVNLPVLRDGSMVPMKRKIATNENTPRADPRENNATIARPKLATPNNVIPLTRQPTADVQKEAFDQPQTRVDKMKALQRSGPRVFSGPVEKVLKWHKALQDIGVLILYEIVASCVSIRPDGGFAKNLVVRDVSGPAMQVIYYEIDFMLPELKPPCTIRVIGRMMPGTNRLQAFNVRAATSDDVATLSRRAAVGAHYVAKLCKEFGPDAA